MKTINVKQTSIPVLGLGTWDLRGSLCRKIVAEALEMGYRHIDTAQSYENEEGVGAGVRDAAMDRSEVFITTKVAQDRLAYEHVIVSTDESLQRLGMDYVDLLLVHWPTTDDVPLDETLDAFQKLQADGKARLIGVSNFTPSLLKQALRLAPIACNQVEYHPYLAQTELLSMAREHNLVQTAYCPIAQSKVLNDSVIEQIGERHGKSAPQVTLRWLVQQDRVAAIPRSSKPEHVRSNFDVFDFELSDDEMKSIHALARGDRLVDTDSAPWNNE